MQRGMAGFSAALKLRRKKPPTEGEQKDRRDCTAEGGDHRKVEQLFRSTEKVDDARKKSEGSRVKNLCQELASTPAWKRKDFSPALQI